MSHLGATDYRTSLPDPWIENYTSEYMCTHFLNYVIFNAH